MTTSVGWDNSYARDLAEFGVPAQPTIPPKPELLWLNTALADELALSAEARSPSWLSGAVIPDGAQPFAQAYAGHQFGNFSPVLGDGRALLLGEWRDPEGQRWDVGLKGSGATVFSRGGDGQAHVGAVLRECLISEAMQALGVPTTRSLAAVATGAAVRRETLLPGAVLARVASSHLRVGTFEFVRARGTLAHLTRLADYAVHRHQPALAELTGSERYRALLHAVAQAQGRLIADWLAVGFVHGVMNTDNVTISGETIDYGPCAFLDAYDPEAVFSSIDSSGRYRYGEQPRIGAWNLARFAEALLPLLAEDPDDVTAGIAAAEPALDTFWGTFGEQRRQRFAAKLGIAAATAQDDVLIDQFLALLAADRVDFTTAWRGLAHRLRGDQDAVRDDLLDRVGFDDWERLWLERLAVRPREAQALSIAEGMDAVNPLYIPRNHVVEQALTAALAEDLLPFEQLLERLRAPYDEVPGAGLFAVPAPSEWTAAYQTFCGT